MNKEINIKVISKIDEKFIKKWEKLWKISKHAHFFNSPLWFTSYIEAFNCQEYFIFCLISGDELLATLPLIKTRKAGVEVLASPGGSGLDKSTLLVKEGSESLLNILIKKLKTCGNFYLAELPESFVSIIKTKHQDMLKLFSSGCPYLPFNDDPLKFLVKKQKNKIASRFSRNQKYILFRHYDSDHLIHLKEVYEVDKNSYKKIKGLKTISEDTKYMKLLGKIIEKSPGNVSIDVLYFKKLPIVYNLGYISKNTYYSVNTAYRWEYRDISPGKLLLFFLLQALKRKDVYNFDFSRGRNILKAEFTPYSVDQYDIYYSANPLIRIFWFNIHTLKNMIIDRQVIYKLICKTRSRLNILKNSFLLQQT